MKPTTRALFLCLLVFTSARAVGGQRSSDATCALLLTYLGRANIVPGTRYLELPPNSERRLLYAAVEDDRGAQFLAVIGYRGRHEQIDMALEVMRDLEELRPFRYLAMGELMLENTRDFTAPGVLVAANETAGFYADWLAGRPGAQNEVARVLPSLRANVPWMVSERPTLVDFAQATRTGAFHLFPGLDAFIEKVEALKRTGKLPATENYRHYLGNLVVRVAVEAEALNHEAQRRGGRYDERHLAALEKLVGDPLTNDALRLYVRWTQNDGAAIPHGDSVATALEKGRSGNLSPTEWQRFAAEFEALVEAASASADVAHLTATVQVIQIRPAPP